MTLWPIITTYQIYMKFCIVTNKRMANTKMGFIFQICYATPVIRLLIGVISDLKVTCNYLSDLNVIFYSDQWMMMENTMMAFIFQISYATPVIKLLIRVISDHKANYNYLSDLDEMFHTKQLRNGECNSDNYFSNFYNF